MPVVLEVVFIYYDRSWAGVYDIEVICVLLTGHICMSRWLIMNDNTPIMDPSLAHWYRRQRIIRYAALIASIIVSVTANILQSLYNREPYHTSALSGEAWLLELLCGHPMRIRTELGMSVEVFDNLVQELRDIGYQNSKHVSLEEQLAIFLYTCVTGMTIRHVGERFQRSNETISR
jgi:hypothetical protein